MCLFIMNCKSFVYICSWLLITYLLVVSHFSNKNCLTLFFCKKIMFPLSLETEMRLYNNSKLPKNFFIERVLCVTINFFCNVKKFNCPEKISWSSLIQFIFWSCDDGCMFLFYSLLVLLHKKMSIIWKKIKLTVFRHHSSKLENLNFCVHLKIII